MSHMVIYRGADGKPGYHQTDEIHDAVGFVERMRNEEGVEHARIFRLEEVVFEYRPYYRVELAGAHDGQPAISDLNGSSVIEAEIPRPETPAIGASQNGSAEAIDLPDDVIEVIDGVEEPSPAMEQGRTGKSLFGR